jgi:hypothetical protein
VPVIADERIEEEAPVVQRLVLVGIEIRLHAVALRDPLRGGQGRYVVGNDRTQPLGEIGEVPDDGTGPFLGPVQLLVAPHIRLQGSTEKAEVLPGGCRAGDPVQPIFDPRRREARGGDVNSLCLLQEQDLLEDPRVPSERDLEMIRIFFMCDFPSDPRPYIGIEELPDRG